MQQDYKSESLVSKQQKKRYQRRTTLLTSFLILAIMLSGGTGVIALSHALMYPTVARAAAPNAQDEVAFLQQQAKKRLHVTSPTVDSNPEHKSMAKAVATNSIATPAFNNTGISTIISNPVLNESIVTRANFDGANYSYSYKSLLEDDIAPNIPFISNGLLFNWTNTDTTNGNGQSDNWQTIGQILPLSQIAGASKVGFIGSASNGAASGTARVTYSDGTTQNVTIGFSDWTLGGSKQLPIAGNTIISAQGSRNTISAEQSVKTYLFYTSISLQTSKTAVSITLPTLSGKPQIHIFAYSDIVSTNASAYNSVGTSDDAYPTPGNFDGSGNSYSSTDLGWGTGNIIDYNENPDITGSYSMRFAWPDVLPGAPDNYLANGQTIPVTSVSGATKIGFVGAAANGPSVGTAYLNYNDGTRQAFQLGFSDWTLRGYTQGPSYDNRYFYGMAYRNTPNGQQDLTSFLYYAETNIKPGETVVSVTLPSQVSQGQLHVYSVATGAAGFFDNVGVSYNVGPLFGDFDGAFHSYSANELLQAGINLSVLPENPEPLPYNGVEISVPDGDGVFPDNWVANGQIINTPTAVSGATALAFVGSAANGNSTGTATINYTDGSSTQFSLGFSDWCSQTAPLYGNAIIATMPDRNSSAGSQAVKNYLYYAETPVDPTKMVKSVVLPVTTGGSMHIFDMAERTSGQYNNTGTSPDYAPSAANLDGTGYSYSQSALATSGYTPGKTFSLFDHVSFTWPTLSTGQPDNYVTQGQIINETAHPNASKLGFLLSATNGSTTGTATVTYTDGTTQSVTLKASDWCDKTTATSNGLYVIANMSYRNSYRNAVNSQVMTPNYLYQQSFDIDATKIVQSITLPNVINLHIFSIGTN